MTLNQLAIELTEANELGARMAILRIDGRPLIDIIREIEAPLAAATGEPTLAVACQDSGGRGSCELA
jgi:hypothetical protein